jgi:hypothetical protein
MTQALPPLQSWPDLTEADVEILSPGDADADGRWSANVPLVLRLHGQWILSAEPSHDGLLLKQAALRPRPWGMVWTGSDVVGTLAYHPDDREVVRDAYKIYAFEYVTTKVLPPRAATPEARRAVFLRAFSRALGPAARQRIEALQALATLHLLNQNAWKGTIKPLLPNGPKIVVHKMGGQIVHQALFRRRDGGQRPFPDVVALLHGGDCRQVLHDTSSEFLCPCDEIDVRVDAHPSRHAVLALAQDVIDRFDALGVDVRPWLVRRTR